MVEGKLIAPWAAELRSACHTATVDLNGRQLVIDMHNLTVINQEGENVVLELMNEGVMFRASGIYAKFVLANVARRAHAKLQEPIL